ncbi:MAG TPA: hypothetical protein VHW26_11260 [Solirubrobacteraceae bacterium]|nr:hypothetical protein [Solirubrobacteraceae bacterium]
MPIRDASRLRLAGGPGPRLSLGVPPAVALIACALAGCGGSTRPQVASSRLPSSYIPLSVGIGPRYRPPLPAGSGGPSTESHAGQRLACEPDIGPRFGVHVELFAHRHVVLIPAGIGISAPVRPGAFVRGGRCYRPLVTLDPTGVIDVRPSARPFTLRTLFGLWGQGLGATRLAGFTGHAVHAFVDGRPVPGDPAEIRLRRHDEIVLETSGHVVPHDTYRFARPPAAG